MVRRAFLCIRRRPRQGGLVFLQAAEVDFVVSGRDYNVRPYTMTSIIKAIFLHIWYIRVNRHDRDRLFPGIKLLQFETRCPYRARSSEEVTRRDDETVEFEVDIEDRVGEGVDIWDDRHLSYALFEDSAFHFAPFAFGEEAVHREGHVSCVVG